MPLKAINHKNTIIYKIQHNDKPELLYIGHTTNFDSRKYQHRKSALKESGAIYELIREHGGWDAFTMSPIKQISCQNRIDALIEEQQCIDELGATLNFNPSHKLTAKKDLNTYRTEYNKLITLRVERKKDKMRQSIEREINFMEKHKNCKCEKC